jgi:hypothetical protein
MAFVTEASMEAYPDSVRAMSACRHYLSCFRVLYVLFSCFVRFAVYFICSVFFVLFYILFLLVYIVALSICVQVYGPLPPGRNAVAVNKYHTMCSTQYHHTLKYRLINFLMCSFNLIFIHCFFLFATSHTQLTSHGLLITMILREKYNFRTFFTRHPHNFSVVFISKIHLSKNLAVC